MGVDKLDRIGLFGTVQQSTMKPDLHHRTSQLFEISRLIFLLLLLQLLAVVYAYLQCF